MQNQSEMASQEYMSMLRVAIDIKSAFVKTTDESISKIQIIINPKIIVWTQDIQNPSNINHQGQSRNFMMDQISFRYETEMYIQQQIMEIYRTKLQIIRKQKEDLNRIQQEKMELQIKRQQERQMKEREIKEDLAKREEEEKKRREEQERARETHRKEQQEKQKNDKTKPKNVVPYKAVVEPKHSNRPPSNNIFGRIEANPNPSNQNRYVANPVNNSTANRGPSPYLSDNIFGGVSNNMGASRSCQEIATYQGNQNNNTSNQNINWQREERQPASSINIFQTSTSNQPTNFSLTNKSAASLFQTRPAQQSTSLFHSAPANNNNNKNNKIPGKFDNYQTRNKNKKNDRI